MESFRFPTVRTLLLFWGCSCAAFLLALEILPFLLGSIIASFFDFIGMLSFLAEHPFIYSCIKFFQWLFYIVCAVAVLDLVFIFFIYKILNEVLATSADFKGLSNLALRALPGAFLVQFKIGIFAALALLISGTFSPMAVFPSPLNASGAGALVSTLWISSLAWYSCSFAMKENIFASFRYGAELLRKHKYFWISFAFAIFLAVWLPGFFAETLGFDPSVGFFGTFVMICLGSADILIALIGGLIYFFNYPDAFDVEESAG